MRQLDRFFSAFSVRRLNARLSSQDLYAEGCAQPGGVRHKPSRSARRDFVLVCCVAPLLGLGTWATAQMAPAAVNFGSVNIGGTSAPQTITYTFASATSLGNISVLTQGVSGRDFNNAGTGTCTSGSNYSAGNTCTVAVSFTPAVAGTRYGALVLMNGSGNPVATAYLQGTGAGPQAVFTPGNAAFVLSSAVKPNDIAVDPAGNVYIADLGSDRILKETVTGSGYSESVIPTTAVKGPVGIAVDGAGNLYIGDNVVNEVIKETRTATGYVESILPTSSMNGTGCVKVDGAGNVYISDHSNNRVLKETLSGSGYSESTIPVSALHNPEGIAVDGNGSVYIADDAGEIWMETPSSNGYTESVVNSTAKSKPTGIAVDGMGNVYIAASGNNVVFEETPSSSGYSESTIWTAPTGSPAFVAVDGFGNLYVDNKVNAEVVKLDLADPQTVTFASTPVGNLSVDSPKVVTVQNYGTGSLNLSNLSYPSDFPETLDAVSDCTATTVLTTTATCTFTINFQPVTAFPQYNEPITLTTNTLGKAGTAESLTAVGYGPTVYPVMDSFSGTGALSSMWSSIDGGLHSNLVSPLQSNGRLALTVARKEAMSMYTGASFTNDQYAQATYIAPSSVPNDFTGVCVRMQGYGDGVCYLPDAGTIDVYSNEAASATITSTCPVASSGDTVQLAVVGTLYTCKDITTGASTSASNSTYSEGSPAFILDQSASPNFTLSSFQADCVPSCSAGNMGNLSIYLSPPGAQASTVVGTITETFDSPTPAVFATPYVSAAGIGTYTGTSSNLFAVVAPDVYGGATDSTSTKPTNYFSVGAQSGGFSPITLTLAHPATYFGLWWSAADSFNSVSFYSGGTLYGTLSATDISTFLNGGAGSVTALNGTQYQASSYFGNPNFASPSNDGGEVFVYVSFATTNGATIDTVVFSNPSTTTGFESDNHSVIFAGNPVSIPGTFVPLHQAAQPVFSPPAGTYSSPQTVAISTTTPSATIYYTTDGTTPTTASAVYTGPITVGSTETVRAMAMATNYSQSLIGLATYTIGQAISVSVSPNAASLTSGQSQQFGSTVTNASNTAVTWSIAPSGLGTISSSGLYTAPTAISTQQVVTITATSQADSTKSATATIYLLPPCTNNGYSFVRSIVIDHTKVPNTDQVNFPFLFSTTDPALKSTANGGHVTSLSGNDIIFSTDPKGATKLDHELEEYNPATGQVIAWVRIPTLSHTVNTVLYMFYGNSSVTTSQQNPTGVWGSTFVGVWHLPNGTTLSTMDSTSNGKNGTDYGATAASGKIDGAASFNGSSYIDIGNLGTFPAQGTIDFWMQPSSISSYPNAFSTNYNGGNNAIRFEEDSAGDFGVVIGNGSFSFNGYSLTSGGLALNAWYHIVLTWNTTASTAAGYFNGSPAFNTSSSNLWPSSLQDVAIGSGYNSGRDWNGLIDEVRISNAARSADWIATEYANESNPASFYNLSSESDVAVSPAAVSLFASQAQQFSAAVLAPGTCSPSVLWSMPPDSPGTLSGDGLYTAPASIAARQTVIITATNPANKADTGTALVTLLPPPLNPTIALVAVTQSPYVTGTSQQFKATVKNEDGLPFGDATVTFTVTGVNSTSVTATTDNTGVATFSYTGANSGSDSIQASLNAEGAQAKSNTVPVSWLLPAQLISTTTVTGKFFFSDGSCSFNISPNTTPAFVQVFPTINFNPGSYVPGNTSGVNGGTRPFTDVTTDINGNFTGTIVAQGNGYQAGVTTSSWDMNSFEAVFQGTFVVANAGNVTFDFVDDDGFILGIGNGATRVSGSNLNIPATTPFAQYPSMGAYNGPSAGLGNQVVVNFPNPGTYPYEVDYTECRGDGLTLTMAQGANSTGTPPTGALTLSPNSNQTQPAGGDAPFTVVATDATGAPVPNLAVGLTVSGDDSVELKGTTDANGKVAFDYRDVNPGTVTVQASAVISNMVAYSNQAMIFWAQNAAGSGGNGTLSISLSAQDPVTLPNTLQLTGTVRDSALPQGDTITTTWSLLSGPGTVTFGNPNQASTAASFSAPGTYVLQLSAQDVDAQGSAQITITVKPPSGNAQGWIGASLDGASLTGIVPIKVASSETLTSGVLTFYPADNPNDVTTLNSHTTGSGQIGTFDTTQLQNGQYWIALQATDSYGNSSYNLALVTVAGNFKPGRVTSTVTDLVVPADGLAIKIQRTYDSLKASTSSDFGYGWSLGTNVDLSVGSRGDVTFTLGGQRRTFYLAPQFSGFLPFFLPAFTPEAGMHGTLTDTGASCPTFFDYIVPDGNLWACVGGGFYTPQGYVYTDTAGTSYIITAAGVLQSIVDKNGNTLTITANGITSSSGPSVPFTRDSNGRITQIKDPQGNIYSYGYDANGNLVSVTYPNVTQSQTCPGTSAPNTTTYTYDSNHRYTGGIDNRCNKLPTTMYYGAGAVDANGLPLTGRLETVTDALNETTSYAYNLATNTTTVTYPADSNNQVGTATLVYDSMGDLLSSTDPLGHKTLNTYDTNQNLLTTTDPLIHTTSYTYDSNGNRTSVTYPNPQSATVTNTTSTTTYNQFSEPTQTTDENGNTRTFNYDVNFNPSTVTDSLGTLASFSFADDGTMRLGAVGYDLNVTPSKASQFAYDANGNLASRTDALGRTTSYTYDSLGHKLTMVEPVPTGSTASAATTTYQYDAFGDLTQTTAPLNRVTSSQYDGNGNKISDTDARMKTTNYQYDALNRLIETDYPDSTKSTKTYDFRGNVVTETDQAGHVTKHVYDLAGRETSVTQAYGTSNATTTSYVYDVAGRKTSETDALGHTTNYTYDTAGNLTGISGVGGTFTYAYDNARNRISSKDGNGYTTQYQYDARKRLTVTTYPDQTTKTNAYDGPGNLISVTDQANNVVQYNYDAANQLAELPRD